MDYEKRNLIKLIGSKVTYIGVIICFIVITTYFVMAGQATENQSISSNELNEVKEEQFEPRLMTATILQNEQIIEHATTEQIEEKSVLDKSAFALLQNNPALGKLSLVEGELESTILLDEQTENESTDSNPEQSEDEAPHENGDPSDSDSTTDPNKQQDSSNENTTPEQEESEPIVEEPIIENDPALDLSIITQQTQQPSFPYSEKLPLPYEHQEYLYSLCMDYGLEYEKVLAVMEHESKFNPSAIGATSDFGYFQINSINHEWLSQKLGTPNSPLDPYVNMQWGTFFLADLYDYWENQGLTGSALEEAVLSSYNKGKTGYRRTGKATNYIEKVRESYALIQNEYM
ncbi:MAG TPA: transglycosylase SLT domain-containing protein [Ureibacillus sp.]|nr:transglycosylase SLT domain-containing protein [Ureibacillus sp.]